MVQTFCEMGFSVDRIVAAFLSVGVSPNDGNSYDLDQASIDSVLAVLFDENRQGIT